MDIKNNLIQIAKEGFPERNDLLSIVDKLHIPHIQRLCQLRRKSNIFEQLISLIQNLIIVRQILQINLMKLTQFQIHKTPSLRRTIFYDIQILWRKKHQIHNSKQLRRLLNGNSVDGNPLGTVLLQMHVDLMGNSILLHHHSDMRFILMKPNHILVLTSPVGLCRSRKINRLQNIGFSLRVIPVENIGRRIKVYA